MYYFILLFSILAYTLPYSVVFEDFNSSRAYISETMGVTHFYDSSFMDSSGDLVYVNRELSENSQFILTQGNLYYDGSTITESNFHIRENEFKYTYRYDLGHFESNYRKKGVKTGANLEGLPRLKFNFSNISKPFMADIKIFLKEGVKTIKNYPFNSADLSQNINMIETPGIISNFNEDIILNFSRNDLIARFSEVENISFLMNAGNDPAVNFNLTSMELEAVPEPFSLISLATSMAIFIKKKKKFISV